VHAFLACDLPGLSRDARLERAGRLLTGHGARGALAPESLLLASESFSAFVEQQLPGARWRREIPIEVRLGTEHGERLIDGRIDLLLETDDRLVIVDHKSFPGSSDAALRAKAGELAAQLAAYAHALAIARPGRRIDCWLHFVTAGAVVELSSAAR
jgi:ATP-dependent exoDNAse (exonuclease V) beta subunit